MKRKTKSGFRRKPLQTLLFHKWKHILKPLAWFSLCTRDSTKIFQRKQKMTSSHKISRNLSRYNYVNNLLKPSGWTKWTTRGPRILDNLVRTHFLTRFVLFCFIFQVLFTSWRAGKKVKVKDKQGHINTDFIYQQIEDKKRHFFDISKLKFRASRTHDFQVL